MQDIDFVIPWVDGSDEDWRKEKDKFSQGTINNVSTDNRYRDWGILHYWFRGVEKFAPWVHKIYFVTCGHIPGWLNTENDKLVLVNHKDYIPEQYLPTFSANPIELNMNRIPGLKEHFVYFNDDCFIIRPVKMEDFFQKGLPVDASIESVLANSVMDDIFQYILLNDTTVINKHFDKKVTVKNNKSKWFSINYGKRLLNNLFCYPWKSFSTFQLTHLPQAFLKSTLDEVWEAENELLSSVSKNKFRTYKDVNQYLFRYWQFCTGKFTPGRINGIAKTLGKNDGDIENIITKGTYNMVCLNDGSMDIDFDKTQKRVKEAFEIILPEKSSFEI